MVSLHGVEEEEPNGRYKEQWGAEALHSLEPQKAHLTGEFIVVLKIAAVWCYLSLLLWWGSVTKFWVFRFKIQYPVIWNFFLVLNATFDVIWTSTIL